MPKAKDGSCIHCGNPVVFSTVRKVYFCPFCSYEYTEEERLKRRAVDSPGGRKGNDDDIQR